MWGPGRPPTGTLGKGGSPAIQSQEEVISRILDWKESESKGEQRTLMWGQGPGQAPCPLGPHLLTCAVMRLGQLRGPALCHVVMETFLSLHSSLAGSKAGVGARASF